MSKGQEKREYKRYESLPIEVPITAKFQIRSYEAQEMESNDWDSVILENISAGGTLFIRNPRYIKDLEIGALLYLEIYMPKTILIINCVGEIIRIDKLQDISVSYRIAIKFIDIGEQEKETINTTVEKALV